MKMNSCCLQAFKTKYRLHQETKLYYSLVNISSQLCKLVMHCMYLSDPQATGFLIRLYVIYHFVFH